MLGGRLDCAGGCIAHPKHFFTLGQFAERGGQAGGIASHRSAGGYLLERLRVVRARQQRIVPVAFDLPTVQLITFGADR